MPQHIISERSGEDSREPTASDNKWAPPAPIITRKQYTEKYFADHGLPHAYWSATKTEKTLILSRAADALCYHRKSLIRLFARLRDGVQPFVERRGRPRVYSREAREAVVEICELLGHPSERKLVGSLPHWLEANARYGEIEVSPEVVEQLLAMGSATAGRIIREQRPRPRRSERRRRPHSAVQAATPLRHWSEWDELQPGEVQVDSVFHSGGLADGRHLYTLTVIDPYSGWTEAQAVESLRHKHIIPALDRLRQRCPFPWISMHTDNGAEFLNKLTVSWCRAHGIRRTRGRPGKSSDQAYVENTNRTFVRGLVGDLRYEGDAAREILNALYANVSDLTNFYYGRCRLVEKQRNGQKVTRRYDEAQTPYSRLLEAATIEANHLRGLEARFLRINPFESLRERERLLDRLWDLGPKTR